LLRLLSGIEQASREAGYDLLIRAGGSHTNESRSLGHHNTDGLLVFAGVLSDEELAALYRQAFPVVALHSAPISGTAIPVVNIENQQSSYELVSHLIQHHSCRRIAYLRGPEAQKDSYYREQGYSRALRENGIPLDNSLVGFGGFDERIAHNTVLELLRKHPDIDGIFADDESAAGVYHALQELGLRIPDDIKVVGFDDDYLASRLVPPLTTVHSPAELIGETAVQLLLQLIESGSAPIETLLPTHVVVRRSCGCQ
jgi:DNA-binding LacI/PurR family transcriptional regulator